MGERNGRGGVMEEGGAYGDLEGSRRGGGAYAEGGRGMGEGGQSQQMRRNIHLLCDMLGGPSGEPPPALLQAAAPLRARKRRDDDAPGGEAQAHHRPRHGA